MNYSPAPQKSRAGTVSAILLALAAVAYIFSSTGIVSPLPLQIICMGCICAAVYILVRFVYTGMTYIIRPRDGVGDIRLLSADLVDFCVMKTQGRRAPVTECLLSLDKLVCVEEYTDTYVSSLRERYKEAKLYYYTVSMVPGKRQALLFEDDADVYCIVIEADGEFLSLLRSIRPNANENL